MPVASPGPPAGLGGRGAAAAAAVGDRCRLSDDRVAVADAGLGQVELDVARRRPVAGQRGDDRAGLLVAGGEQERRARGRSSSRRSRSSRARGGSARRRRAAARCRRSARSGRSAAPGPGWSRGSGRGRGAARTAMLWSGRNPVADTIRSHGQRRARRRTRSTRPSVWTVSPAPQNPVTSSMVPASTCARSRVPSAPRAGRASAASPP